MIRRLRRWWIAFTAPQLESALCPCGTWFYRRMAPHPDLTCDACRDLEMDQWIAQIRASVG